MKRYYTFITSCVLVSILCSCADTANKDEHKISADQNIRVDQLSASPFQYSSYFAQLDYIPLQATNESLIGYVHNIHTYKDRYFILDISSAKRLFIFDQNGKFIKAIGERGKGRGEFYEIIDFSIEPKAEELYILDQVGKVNIFSLDGKFLRDITIKGPTPHMYNNIEIVGNSIFLDIRYPQPHPSDKYYLLREVTLEGKFKKDWLDMDVVNKGGGKSEFSNIMKSLYATPDGVFYTKEFMDVIYQLEENNVRPVKAIESQFNISKQDIADMNPGENYFVQAGKLDRIFSLSKVITGDDFSYFSYKRGAAPFSLVDRNGTTSLHQFWIDDVSYPGKSFHVQPPQFFATPSDGKTLIGIANGKKNWEGGLEIANQHLGGLDPAITASFAQQFKDADNPVLILYRLK